MNPLSFTLNIEPTAQRRARHGVVNRGKRIFSATYKDTKQKNNELALEYFLLKYLPKEPLPGALSVTFTAFLPIPKKMNKADKELALKNMIFPTNKPDIDNLTKQLLDCMTRLKFWNDDCQIIEVCSRKLYSEKPRWEIRIADFVLEKEI